MNPDDLSAEELSLAKKFKLLLRAYLAAKRSGSPTARLVKLIRNALVNAGLDAARKTWDSVTRGLGVRKKTKVKKRTQDLIEKTADLTVDGIEKRAQEGKFQTEAEIDNHLKLISRSVIRSVSAIAAEDAALESGARFKTWLRAFSAAVPRQHSVLEGRKIPVDQLFNVNGFLAPGPHRDPLPLSETANCKHYLLYTLN